MDNPIQKWFRKKYPRNYLIENPWAGAIIIATFCFVFLLLYKPLGAHASRALTYKLTMAVYSGGTGIAILFIILIINRFKWFSDLKEWNISKEIVSILLIMAGIGTVIYMMGFFLESPGNRLNISTYLNSLMISFLLGLIPFTFFSALNYRYLLNDVDNNDEKLTGSTSVEDQKPEPLIQITSRLKKEGLSFYPDQFIYAESDGNYVIFHLDRNHTMSSEIIRNSISNIEEQLASFPFIIRTHRAFIVNLRKIESKRGNILSYQLKLSGCDSIIPVSRSNIETFEKALSELHR